MSTDVLVGLLTFLGLVYMAWMQADVRRSEANSNDAEAITHMTGSLLQAVQTLADRDKLIVELRTRIEALEEHDRAKTNRIAELEHKVGQLEGERYVLMQERDALVAILAASRDVALVSQSATSET